MTPVSYSDQLHNWIAGKRKGTKFAADDITKVIGKPDKANRPNGRNSSVGALINGDPNCIGTGVYRKSTDPTRKGGKIQVWVRK